MSTAGWWVAVVLLCAALAVAPIRHVLNIRDGRPRRGRR